MKKSQHFFSFLSLFLLFNGVLLGQHATMHSPYTIPSAPNQERCGSDMIHQRLLNNHPVYRQNFEDIQRRVEHEIATNPPSPGRAPILTVPVVFHIMHTGEAEGTGSNISYEQILSALASLNDAFRGRAPYTSSGVDMEIEFCLAAQDPSGNPTNGVNRINASGTSDYAANGITTTGTNNETLIKALSVWPNTDYYNIWVVSEIDGNNGGGGTQGFAYFPGASAAVDGTVILHNATGFDPTASRCFNVKSFTNFNVTLIHELGHAFGLFHTFQGDAGGTACPANVDCTTDGDRVCDTPPHEQSNACQPGTTNLCGTLRDNHIHNFMEYSTEACQTEFTAGQKTRARAFLSGGRPSLLTSAGCTPVAPPVSNFTSECAGTAVAGCTGSVIQFYDLSTHNPTSWSWTFPGGTPASSTAQNPSVTYATAGTYAVTLVASNASGAGNTETKTGYITIYDTPTAACTPGIQNTGFFGYSFSNVTFNNINNSTAPATNGSQDFSCTQTTCVTEGQNYTLSITVGNSGGQGGFYDCFIDYNDDGVFSAAESILSGSTVAGSGYQTITQNVLIPTNAVEGDLLRMRVINDQFNLSGPCDNLFTGESEDYGIFISTAATITTQPSPTSACAGSNASFSVTATGGVSFQWQEDQGSGFVDVTNGGIYSGANSATLNITGVSAPMNGFLYRCVVGNGCDQSVTSNNAALTIGGGLAITTQPSNQDGCVGDNETFTINVPSATTFQWQEDQGSGFVDITNGGIYSGATSASLTLTGISAPLNGFLYRCLVSDGSCSATSNNATLTVNTTPSITTQPINQDGCVGDNETFTVAASSGTFQWQEDQGSGFVDITNGGIYSGATSASLTLTGIAAPLNGFLYRCVVANGACSTTSNNATLTVNTTPSITTQPINQDGCVGDNETFTVAASSGTFQWQEDQGSGFVDITNGGIYSGATSASLTLTGISAPLNGFLYRCVVANGACSATSNNATLTVNTTPSITTQPINQDGCVGDNETFTVAASSGTFQWQEDQGSGFVDITNGGIYSGATSASLTLTGISAPLNGFLYRCLVSDGSCSATSNNATLTVNTTPSITTQPINQDGCVGDNETFTVAASSGTFQWQEDQGSGFVDITNGGIYSGATSASLTLTGISAPLNGFLYRCVVANGACSATSNNATLTVNTTPSITTQPINQDGCVGDNETFTVAASSGTFQWQEDQGSGFVDITNGGIYSGATSASLTLTGISAPLNGFLYRCVVANGACSATSNNATLTVNTTPSITTNLAANTTQCEENDFTLTVATSDATNFQWFEFNGTTWSALVDGGIYTGSNSASLVFTNPTGIDNYQYYCAVSSPCGAVDSDTTLLRLIQITRQPISQVGNAGDTVHFITNSVNETCGNGWEINTGTGWTLLVADPITYPGGVSGDTLNVIVSSTLDAAWYRRVSCGPSCVKASDSAQVSIILFSNVRGNMYDFDGIDDYIAVDTTPLGASNTQDIPYTFEAWVYPDDVATRQVIIGNHNYAGTAGTSIDISGGQARFFKQEGVDMITGPITASEWHHLAGTYDTLTDEMNFYINGILVGTTISTQADAGGIHNIGTHSGDAAVALSDFFNGKMDEVRIWKVARTQTEIRESMHRSLDGTASDLALYYQFDRDKSAGTNFGVRDALGISHSTAQLSTAAYLPSEVHVGGGFSNTQNVTTTGNVLFTGTNLEIDFPITHPNGEVVVTHVITENPVNEPGNAPFETGYWVVNNFGTVNTALAATPLFRYADGSVSTNLLTEFTLYKRPSRAFGAWPQTFSPATTADNTAGNNHCSFAGVNDFSVLFPVNNTVLLDNQSLSFEARASSEQSTLLSWQIEAEKNNQLFEIQRSLDGIHWENIGQVISINAPTLYHFTDVSPANGLNYYRLKIVGISGQTSFSTIKVVEFSQRIGYTVYPNPNQGTFNLDFQGFIGQNYSVSVYDAVGRIVYEQQLSSTKNTLNLSKQAAGMYTLKIQVGAQNYYTKIIISQ